VKLGEAFCNTTRLFLDTAPVIYFVEHNLQYFSLVAPIFNWIDEGRFRVITTPVTLAECLIYPIQHGNIQLQQNFIDIITQRWCIPITPQIGQEAARLRAQFNLSLTDAFQIAAALSTSCESFLTNDSKLKRIIGTGMTIVTVSELEL